MKFFVQDWRKLQRVSTGEVLEFVATKQRKIRLGVVASADVKIFVADNVDMDGAVFVAHGDIFEVEIPTDETIYVQLQSGALEIFVRDFVTDLRVPVRSQDRYVSVAPRATRTEAERMMHTFMANERLRTQVLVRDLERERERLARLAENPPEPYWLRPKKLEKLLAQQKQEETNVEVTEPVAGDDQGET